MSTTINIHTALNLNDEGSSAFAAYMEIERDGDVPLRYLELVFADAQVTVFLPENHVERRQLLERIRTKIDEGIEAAQKAIIDANHAELTTSDGEAIRRDLARENAFFTRTQGWDPSRPDGE